MKEIVCCSFFLILTTAEITMGYIYGERLVSSNYFASGALAHTALQNFKTEFVAPYKAAVTILSDELLKPLADAPVPSSSTAARQRIIPVRTAAKRFHDALLPLDQTLEAHKSQLDAAILNSTVQLSEKQGELLQNEMKISALDAKLYGKGREQEAAREQVEAALQHSRLSETRVSQGYEYAKELRDKTIQRSVAAIQNVANLHAQKTQLLSEHSTTRSALQELRNIIKTMTLQAVEASKAKLWMSQVIIHVAELITPASTLSEIVDALQNMTEMVSLLEVIENRVVAYTNDINDVEVFRRLKTSIRSSVAVLKQKLPHYPLLDETDYTGESTEEERHLTTTTSLTIKTIRYDPQIYDWRATCLGDHFGVMVNANDSKECLRKCLLHDGCRMVTFTDLWKTNNCYFFSANGPLRLVKEAHWTVLPVNNHEYAREDNKDFPHGDILADKKPVVQDTTDENVCMLLCNAHPLCTAATWNRSSLVCRMEAITDENNTPPRRSIGDVSFRFLA